MNQVLEFLASNFANIIQGATLIVVIIYTFYTARMTSAARASAEAANNTIKEMKEAREQENAPYIVIYFDIPQNKPLIYLIIKNVGKSIATDVKFTFTPPLSSNVFKNINDTSLITNGISTLPPNYELRTFFDGAINRFGNENFPMTYTVKVGYAEGITKQKKTTEQVLDLSMFYDLLQTREKGFEDLVKAVETVAERTEKINRSVESVSKSLSNGIWVKNSLLASSEINPSPERWYDCLVAKLQECVLLWTISYGKVEEYQENPFRRNLQNKFTLMSEQLLVMLAESPETTSNEIKEALGSIATNLQALGYKEFLRDGGVSVAEFDRLGDKTVQDIDSLIKQIHHEKERITSRNVEEQFD